MSRSLLHRPIVRWMLAAVMAAALVLVLLCLVSAAGSSLAVARPAVMAVNSDAVAGPANANTLHDRSHGYLYAVPGSDGTSLYVAAGRLGDLPVPVYANITVIGPTSHERSHTLAYSADTGEYAHTFEGLFDAGVIAQGAIAISSTTTTVLGDSSYIRHFVPGASPVDLPSTDGLVNLHISASGVPTDTYVLIMPSDAPPGDPPAGRRLIDQAYAIQASGALTQSLRPMLLRMSYEPAWLAGADPSTLGLFAWDELGQRWMNLGGNHNQEQHYVSQSIRRFTAYALMVATPPKLYLPLVVANNLSPSPSPARGGETFSPFPRREGGWGVRSTPPIAWSAPINLSDNAGHSLAPALTVDGAGTLHAAWYDNSAGNLDVFYASKQADAAAWSSAVNVSHTPGGSYWPAIAVDGQGNVHVAWDDSGVNREILYVIKPAGSATWTAPANISNSAGTSRLVALAADAAGNVHAVWNDDTPGNAEIYYALRPAGGTTWTAPVVIAATADTAWSPAIALDAAGAVHVAWHDFTPGVTEIYYATKPPGGAWSSPANVSRTIGASYSPALLADSRGWLHLVWTDAIVADYGARFEVLYAQKPPGGQWSPYVNLSQGTGSAEMPALALGPADALHVAWDTTDAFGLLYVRRPAPEMGWTAPMTVTAVSPGAQYPAPSLAAGPGALVHLAWSDFGPLSRDILYSRAAPPPIPQNHVLVVDEAGRAVAGASIYRNGALAGATDDSGVYVPPELTVGDILVALQPLAEKTTVRGLHATPDSAGSNWAYRTYITSMDMDANGETQPHMVAGLGQQRLVVKQGNPLILYNLLVSLEWDASSAYMNQIAEAMRQASDYLYDASDGQMAFGHVVIYDRWAGWNDADIQVAVRNNVRPYAYVGGLTAADRSQVIRVGRYWDGASGSQGDWDQRNGYRTLIHEFGHYGLYLYDEYFGYVFQDGVLVGEQTTHCTGPENRNAATEAINASLMDYQYTSTELAARGAPGRWSAACEQTAQWQLNEESDWETIVRRYGDAAASARWRIVTPATRGAVMPGPDAFTRHALPFPGTEVHNAGTDTPALQLTVLRAGGSGYAGALVVLDPPGDAVADQGFTDATGRIALFGGTAGDEVRVRALDTGLSGQLVLDQRLAYTLTLAPPAGLTAATQGENAYVNLVPGSDGRTLYLAMRGVSAGGALYALVAPPGGGSPVRTLLAAAPGSSVYTGTLSLAATAPGIGVLHVRGLGPVGETVALDSDFSLHPVDASQEGDFYTADGNLWLHLDRGSTGDDAYAVLMPSGGMPPLPAGLRSIGHAYAVQFSGARSRLARPGVLKLFYHPDLTLGAFGLSIYRWNESAEVWEALASEHDAGQRAVAASFDRPGIYVLLGVEGEVERTFLPMMAR